MGFQFLNALFVQPVMGYDALAIGLAFLPTPLVIGPVSLLLAPRLVGRSGPRLVLFAGLSLLLRYPPSEDTQLDGGMHDDEPGDREPGDREPGDREPSDREPSESKPHAGAPGEGDPRNGGVPARDQIDINR
ncbi:hypothetical protein GCM10010172_59300 [Paractinoplanes ferrugineus]|uniref:MFS transporter n=1 Tax=Paractinoplanes ferrugineus TaxID=113564 RepID=A0A919J6T9_9ACTN|nr:hypothetical protein [Actinoplanes ferrugineus]GIE14392.1 hypothetical protein Afe05nite_62320 [Actinoplanes ferrugineus]